MDPLEGIVDFNEERKLTVFDSIAEQVMLLEEFQEFVDAAKQNNENETIDALCDIVVVAVGGIHKLGYDPKKALIETVKEISSRQGSFNEAIGKWQKDTNQDPGTLYKANYALARR